MATKVLIHSTINWSDIAAFVIPNLEDYCIKHGYDLEWQEVLPYSTYTGIEKLTMIRECLEIGDIAIVLDCDTLLTNHSVKIESFIDEKHDFFICEGLNAGVFIVKSSVWLNVFIDSMMELIRDGKYHCEQDAIVDLMKNRNVSRMVKVLPHPAFNSYLSELYPDIPQPVTKEQGQWEPELFLCHLPALSIEKRIEELNKLKQQIVR